MHVELDIFSGRPNPGWEVAGPQREEFLEALRSLPESTARPPLNDGLGYRGFVVTHLVTEEADKAIAYQGHVTVQARGRTRVLADAGRSMERWLLETGSEHLDQSLHAMVLQEINA